MVSVQCLLVMSCVVKYYVRLCKVVLLLILFLYISVRFSVEGSSSHRHNYFQVNYQRSATIQGRSVTKGQSLNS